MAKLKSVSPVSNEDPSKLPVRDLEAAITYWESALGFRRITSDASSANFRRDRVEVGVSLDTTHKPKDAGSLAFCVDDLDSLHRELTEWGGKPGEFGVQSWGGRRFRTFFIRENTNGYCYCFYSPT